MIRSFLRALWGALREPSPRRDDEDRRDGNGSIPPPPSEVYVTEIKEEWIGGKRYEELVRLENERQASLRFKKPPEGES